MSQFKVIASRTVDRPGEKKYVLYTVLVRKPVFDGAEDCKPAMLERRYTDFLGLYTALSHDHSLLVSSISFPKKVVFGNFSDSVIAKRTCAFERLLKVISDNERLRETDALHSFLIDPEEKRVHEFVELCQHTQAVPFMENIFIVLNKVYTDRHPNVITALCKLAACCSYQYSTMQEADRYTSLLLKRFATICDVDLLMFYVPLLHLCDSVWVHLGRDPARLRNQMHELSRQGHQVSGLLPLYDAVLSYQRSTKRQLLGLREQPTVV